MKTNLPVLHMYVIYILYTHVNQHFLLNFHLFNNSITSFIPFLSAPRV